MNTLAYESIFMLLDFFSSLYDDDTQLPGGSLVPKFGNTYILWNISMPPMYYTLAEEEYRTAVDKYNEDNAIDVAVYKGSTDHVWVEDNNADLFVGRLVKLVSEEYFPGIGYRSSRITKISRNINVPGKVDLEISDALSKGTMDKISNDINDAKNYSKSLIGNTTLSDIIRSWDTPQPTDTNLFSARRTQKEFASKIKPDTCQKKMRFLEGLDIGDYVSGEKGGCVDAEGNAEFLTLVIRNLLRSTKFRDGFDGEGFKMWMEELDGLAHLTVDKLTVRQTMTIFELLIQKVRSIGGQFIVSAANGKIKEVTEDGDNDVITFEQDNTFVAHDLMRMAVMSGAEQRSYWVEIASATSKSVIVAISQFESAAPEAGDEVVLMGNTQNKLRQNLISIAATEDGQPRIDVMDGVCSKSFSNTLRVRLGNLDGINDNRFPLDNQPKGNGLYGDNVYLVGTFMLSTGEDVLTKFNVMEGKIETAIEGLRQDFADDKSYLDNGTFSDGMNKWDTENEATFFLLGNRWIWANGAPYSNKTNYAAVRNDIGRTAVFIKNKYILQKHDNFRSTPTYTDVNDEGEKIPEAVYLSFFYRCAVGGRLRVDFENADKTGFENFNMFSIDEEIDPTDGYVTFNRDGLWNGTGDFKLSFTGEIYVYMLMLSTDKVEALAYKYKTLFEQSEKLIMIAAKNFDKDGNVLEESSIITSAKFNELMSQRFNENGELINKAGLVTTTGFEEYKKSIEDAGYLDSDGVLFQIQSKLDDKTIMSVEAFTGMFATAVAENGLVKTGDISLFVSKDDVGQLISEAHIKADQIQLEGIVTANNYFKILKDGSIEATNGTFRGRIEASSGIISGICNMYELRIDCDNRKVVITGPDDVISQTDFSPRDTANVYEYISIGDFISTHAFGTTVPGTDTIEYLHSYVAPQISLKSPLGKDFNSDDHRYLRIDPYNGIVIGVKNSKYFPDDEHQSIISSSGVVLQASFMMLLNIPTDSSFCQSGQLYRDGNTLKIKN